MPLDSRPFSRTHPLVNSYAHDFSRVQSLFVGNSSDHDAWRATIERARGAFYGVLVGEAVIFACWKYTDLAFLWFNVVGCLVVVVTGLAVSLLSVRPRKRSLGAPVFRSSWFSDL